MSIPRRAVETFAGTDLNTMTSSAPRLTFWLVRGLDESPDVRGEDTVIPGAAGRTARNRVRDRRTIEIEGFVGGVGADQAAQTDDFRDAMETLRTLFAPTASAGSLVVALEDGVRTATISCRPLPTMVTSYVGDSAATVSIELEAIGSDWAVA